MRETNNGQAPDTDRGGVQVLSNPPVLVLALAVASGDSSYLRHKPDPQRRLAVPPDRDAAFYPTALDWWESLLEESSDPRDVLLVPQTTAEVPGLGRYPELEHVVEHLLPNLGGWVGAAAAQTEKTVQHDLSSHTTWRLMKESAQQLRDRGVVSKQKLNVVVLPIATSMIVSSTTLIVPHELFADDIAYASLLRSHLGA